MPTYVRSRRAPGADAEAADDPEDDFEDGKEHPWNPATLRVCVLVIMAVTFGMGFCWYVLRLTLAGMSGLEALNSVEVTFASNGATVVKDVASDDEFEKKLPLHRKHNQVQQDEGLPHGPESPGHEPQLEDRNATRVRCATTAGAISIDVHWSWAPHGAARFLDMVRGGFFDTRVALFRSVRGFICQTGIAGDPVVHKAWQERGRIPDDPQWLSKADGRRMKRGYLSFAGGGKDSRSLEFFFAYRDVGLGTALWEVPFGTLVGDESFDNMDHFYTSYGDLKVFGGKAPEQGLMYKDGLEYLEKEFPHIDYIIACRVVEHKPA